MCQSQFALDSNLSTLKKFNTYLLNDLQEYLSSDLKNVFSLSIWRMIVEYWAEGSFFSLRCPVSNKLLLDPAVIVHPLIAPLVYDRGTILEALAEGELEPFRLHLDQVKSAPFIKSFIEQITQISPELSLVPLDKSKTTDPGDDKNASSSALVEHLNQPDITEQNNLAKLLKREIDLARKRGDVSLDLLSVAKELDSYAIEKYFYHFGSEPSNQAALPFFSIGIFLLTIFLSSEWFEIKNQHYLFRYPLCLGYIINQINLAEHASEHQHLRRYENNWVLIPIVLHYLSDIIDSKYIKYQNLVPSNGSPVLFLNAMLDAAITSAAINFVFTTDKNNLVKPFPNGTMLTHLFNVISVSNLIFKNYYTWQQLNNWSGEPTIFFQIAVSSLSLITLPRKLCGNLQAAEDCKKVIRHSYRFFSSQEEGRLFNSIKLLSRFSSAILMGMFAYTISENPIYALIAGIAMFNESAVANLINLDNNLYRLKW